MKINWKKIFDWSVCDVQLPYPVFLDGEIVSYKVNVTYRYHGVREVIFFFGLNRASRAQNFYDKMHKKVQRATKNR